LKFKYLFSNVFLFIFADVVFFQNNANSLESATKGKFKQIDTDDKKQSSIAQGIGGQP
jgi:hypothetical protein